MKTPSISVVIPTHNRAPLLAKSVASIQAQTLQDFEIIIVDDASEDSTPQIIAELIKSDGRISSFRSEKNIGPGAARNLGVQLARGPLIAFLDDDDISIPERLQIQSSIFLSHPEMEVVFSAVCWVDGDGIEIQKSPGIVINYQFPEDPRQIFRLLYLYSNKIPCTTVMAKKEVLINYPYPSEPWVGEDWLMVMKMAASGVRFYPIPECLVNQRRETGHTSLMRNTTYAHASQRQVLKLIRIWLKEKEIHTFDDLHAKALSNQIVREARCWPGFQGLFMDLGALCLYPGNDYAWDTLRWFLSKAISRGKRSFRRTQISS